MQPPSGAEGTPFPQRLKPVFMNRPGGTAEGVPFQTGHANSAITLKTSELPKLNA